MTLPKILIVEDEILVALHLRRGLIRSGYGVYEPVASGEKAVEAARALSPDVILMDIRLLGAMDGIEAARQIRSFLAATIIFTTGYQDLDLKERAMALEPAAYLIKPVDANQIITILEPLYESE